MFYRKSSKRRKIKVIPLVILCGTVMYVLTVWFIWEPQSRIFNTCKKQVMPSKPGLFPAPKHSTGESAVKIQTCSPSIRTCSLSILSLSGQRIKTWKFVATKWPLGIILWAEQKHSYCSHWGCWEKLKIKSRYVLPTSQVITEKKEEEKVRSIAFYVSRVTSIKKHTQCTRRSHWSVWQVAFLLLFSKSSKLCFTFDERLKARPNE